MLTRIGVICLAAFFIVSPASMGGKRDASITVLTSFDYPGTSTATFPAEINDRGDIAGSFSDSDGLQRGFVRFANGRFTPPIVPPFTVGDFTGADDINDSRTICGFFYEPDGVTVHGYFISQGVFTQFDIEGAIYTAVVALNDLGDFTGTFENDSSGSSGYVDVSGNLSLFTVPGAAFTNANSINNLDEVTGNYRIGIETTNHGFFRKASGDLIYPIDFPGALGSLGTIVSGMNDRGWLVGRYYDSNSIDHGFLFKPPTTFLSFDYPQAVSTRLTGINNRGLVCGEYQDLVARHGFIARVQ